ncbi:hypothetical protein B0F90DRAFT_1673496 [Multifurca ochricompacta]|uniref:Secreted protein n=1 Tax=Multifurca ochricompacta TaxID=376703 RepID=A0AAD4MC51_9AGAM|nr:hypothetical protein B0F90DRAFT_1673496 [Multifurca ochricompacta]
MPLSFTVYLSAIYLILQESLLPKTLGPPSSAQRDSTYHKVHGTVAGRAISAPDTPAWCRRVWSLVTCAKKSQKAT